MYITVEAADLTRVLSVVKGCVPNRTTIPILQHVLLIGSGSTLTVKATDLQCEAEASCAAQMDDNWILALPGKVLSGIARRLPPGSQVSITAKSLARVEVACGSSRFVLGAPDDVDAFPSLRETLDEVTPFTMSTAVLCKLLTKTAYASHHDVVLEPGLYGVHMHTEGDNLVAVSANRRQFCRWAEALPAGAKDFPPILLPLEAVGTMARVLEGINGDVSVLVNDRMFGFATETMRFSTLLMEHKFLDYSRVAPKRVSPHVTVHPGPLKEAAERALVIYSGPSLDKTPCAQFDAFDGRLILSMGSPGNSMAQEEIEAVVNDARCFILETKLLTDLIREWPEDAEIDIQQEGPGKAILFTTARYPNFYHVIMPQTRKKIEVEEAA